MFHLVLSFMIWQGNAAQIAEGREIYNRACTICHGLEGTVGDRAPALAGNRRYLRMSREDLFDAIKNGISGTLMPPTPLSDPEIWKVVDYIRSLRATAADTPVGGDVGRGEEIFWGKGECGRCHMISGRGGLLGPDLSNIGRERRLNYIRAALTEGRPRPSRGYRPVRVTMTDGRTLEGILKNEHNFSLQVLGLDLRLHLLDRREVREISYGEKPLMPVDYAKRLSAEELDNLLAFLSRQARTKEGR